MTPYLLLFLGYLMVYLEFFLPGGVMGILGAISIVSSIVLFALESSSGVAVFLYLVGSIFGLIVLVKLTLRQIQTKGKGRGIYSDEDQAGYQAASWDPSLVGKSGVAYTDLRPGGYIIVEGQQLPAISQSGYLLKGTDVVVLGGEGDTLMIKTKEKE